MANSESNYDDLYDDYANDYDVFELDVASIPRFDSNYDYPYDDYTDDSEDEVSELDVPARFVSKDPQREVERGQTAKLECAVERWIFSNFLQF